LHFAVKISFILTPVAAVAAMRSHAWVYIFRAVLMKMPGVKKKLRALKNYDNTEVQSWASAAFFPGEGKNFPGGARTYFLPTKKILFSPKKSKNILFLASRARGGARALLAQDAHEHKGSSPHKTFRY
jgi:hypothetical protein